MVIGLCAFSNARNNVNISSISKKFQKKERENLLQFVWRNGWFFTGQWTRLFVLRCDFCCYWWVHFSNALCNNFHSVLPLFCFRCTNIVIVIAEMVSKIQINFFWVFQFILFYYSSYCHGVSSMLDVLWFWINCQTH